MRVQASHLGWTTCIPFDYDPMTGEPITQCGSISDQMPCDAGVPQYPGSYGYCPATDNGYVPSMFEEQLGLRGLGRGYLDDAVGGFQPIDRVIAENHLTVPQSVLDQIDPLRLHAFDYMPPPAVSRAPAVASPLAVHVVRTPSGRPGYHRYVPPGRHLRGLGDVLCPDGTSQPTLDDCIAHGYTQTSTSPCPSGFQLDPSGAVCVPKSSILPAIVNAVTNGGCPAGFVLHPSGAVCIPANSPAATGTAQTVDWKKIMLYGGAALVGIVVLVMISRR